MRKPLPCSRLILLALTAVVGACGSVGSPVTIRTMGAGLGGCYLSGVEGDLVTDPTAGTAIVDGMGGHRTAVAWPTGWTGRSSGSEVEVLDRHSKVFARTGTRVSLSGGFNPAGDFEVCNLELVP